MLVPITVAEIMQTPVETVKPDDVASVAASRLNSEDIGSLVVCHDQEPVGIVTDGDITELVASGDDPETTTVRELMSVPLDTIDESESIEAAARQIREKTIKRLPVVDDEGRIAGIVTTTDLSWYIPHLARLTGERPTVEKVDKGVRADTAYEKDDWQCEYYGDEAEIAVGDVVTFSKTITEDDVRAFAEASGDTNRLHLEPAFAMETRFGEPIVHGTLVAGLISAALARLPGLTVYLSQDLSFLGPVSIGERVTARCAIVEQLGDDRFLLTTEVTDSTDSTVIDGEAAVITDPIPA